MNRLLLAFSTIFLLPACQTSSTSSLAANTPGAVAFGAQAVINDTQYLIEQDALFRSNLSAKGVTTSIQGSILELNIPGNIAFSINSAKLNWNIHEVLDKISPVLREYDKTTILVIGHSDSKGNAQVNQLLSEQRAKVIFDYLVRSGVEPDRLSSQGAGQTDLLIQNDLTTQDRALNRRITLNIKMMDNAQEQ